jgi:hypothetical protein
MTVCAREPAEYVGCAVRSGSRVDTLVLVACLRTHGS